MIKKIVMSNLTAFRVFLLVIFLTGVYQILPVRIAFAGGPLTDIVRGDGGGAGQGYLIPNEDHFYLFNDELKGKTGTLISVGTFRFFQAASQGQFTQVVSFDYAPEVTDFNLGLIRILRTSSNRFDFLSNLFGRPELAMQLRSFEQGKISSDALLRYASEITRVNLDADYISSKNIFPKTINESVIGKFALSLLEIFVDKPRSRLSFLGSNDAFENLKSLSVANRIHVVNGSLSGSNTLFQLGDSLRKIGENISVLDISNAYKYISISGTEGQFLQNLKSLPFSQTAVVAFTEGNFVNKKMGGDGWDYYVVPAQIYLKSASSFAVSNSAEIYPYPYHIFTEKLAKPYQKAQIIGLGKSCSQIFAGH